jgi:hypothetical protein
MPQLPPSDTTATGFTLVTDSLLRTSYRSSLGYVEFHTATLYSNLPEGSIKLLATGTTFASTGTSSGTLVVTGGIGVGANMFIKDDITVNDLLIGQGYSNIDDGAYNNIVIRGTATPTINDFANGQNSVAIGYDALTNLNSSYKSIAIGRYALSTGTRIRNSIAIGDSALKENGVVYDRFILPITSATVFSNKSITNITNALPAVVSVTSHGLTTGSRITIVDVNGLTTGTFSWVNQQSFFINKLDNDSFELYNDDSLSSGTGLDTRLGTSTAYVSSGTLVYPLQITVPNSDYTTGTAVQLTNLFNGLDEIDNYVFYTYPLGSNVFQLYTDGIVANGLDGTNLTPWVSGGTSTRVLLSSNNIAIGTNAGKSLFDGERNFFLGDYIAQNLTTGSYNFFIGHEVGNNLTRGSGNVSIMGDNLIDGRDNQVNIGGVFYYNGAGYLQLQSDTGLGLGTTATNTGSGALAVYGGISVSENIISSGPVTVNSNNGSTSPTTGDLVVAGGAGIGGDLWVGGIIHGTVAGAASSDTATNVLGGNTGSIVIQTATNQTGFVAIGSAGTVLLSNGSTPYWGSVGGGQSDTSTNSNHVFVDAVEANTQYYLGLTDTITNYSTVTSDVSVVYDTTDGTLSVPKLSVTSATVSTSTNSNQALLVSGGAAITGGIYNVNGQIDENYLLYTPRITISTSTPLNPRVGDFWIDPNYGVELQYIKDGTSTIWVQFTGL